VNIRALLPDMPQIGLEVFGNSPLVAVRRGLVVSREHVDELDRRRGTIVILLGRSSLVQKIARKEFKPADSKNVFNTVHAALGNAMAVMIEEGAL